MQPFDYLVEGYFVITSDNLIFEVKGIKHPQNRIIAYLRYVPADEHDETRYRKVYNLKDREEYLTLKFPDYLWYSEVYGRVIQSVPTSKIVTVLKPVEFLMHMNSNYEKLNQLQKSSVRLARELVGLTGIPWSNFGITGSQLLNIATETSDIDLVVYGAETCRTFYDNLSEVHDRIPGVVAYSDTSLQKHLTFRWGNLVQYHDVLAEIESRKVLQGLFGKYEFFIRLVKLPQEVNEYYGKMMYEKVGTCQLRCQVIDDRDSIFTPCIYDVQSLDEHQIKRIVSYRGRFTEQARIGMTIEARGRLEKVTDMKTGEEFEQLVLGEDSNDYLLPV